ncbi:hypothetical protein GXY_00214 [Novacetimonas hansenii ATCC 23769]|uniref:Uncharacterized protein n=1 Tax=Novacetimonas hansenii ATCC 23769 TaxID=714995 RepID=D5QAA8_NOVHA|nr:hypothetical protein GXY_00214 [Novacetimonas hansenii ATCC 23769]
MEKVFTLQGKIIPFVPVACLCVAYFAFYLFHQIHLENLFLVSKITTDFFVL